MYKEILIAIDLGEESSWAKALPTAVEYAQKFAANLHLVTVVPNFGMSIVSQYFPKDFEKKALKEAQDHLHDFIKKHVPAGIKTQVIVEHGSIAQEILRAAEKVGADLIVMQSHRPEVQDLLIGPNAGKVVAHAKCSVLVVRD